MSGEPGSSPRSGRQICWRPAHGVDLSTTSKGRAWARRALRRLLPTPPAEALANDLDLVASELITNGVVHGGGVTRVCLQLHGVRLRLTVCDRASGEPTVTSDRSATDHEHGRGMVIIEALAASWGVRRQAAGKMVWLDLAIPR